MLGTVPGVSAVLHGGDPSERLSELVDKTRSAATQAKIREWNFQHGHLVANQGYAWGVAHLRDHEGRERLVA